MTDASYAQLLEDLRRDLQLNPSTDLLPFALASAQNLPWHVDVGTATITFTASATTPVVTVPHHVGRVPWVTLGDSNAANDGVWLAVFNKTDKSFQINGSYSGAITLTTSVDWIAIG